MHFSVKRLLVAVASLAIPFSAFSYMGATGIAISVVVGTSLAVISLVIQRWQILPMLRTGALAILGAFLAHGLFANPISYRYYDYGQFHWYGIGGFFGMVWGMTLTANQRLKLILRRPEKGSKAYHQ